LQAHAVEREVRRVEPYGELALLALGALVLGVVIFGGTTLAYFVGKRTPDSSRHATAVVRDAAPRQGDGPPPASALDDEAA
jgi:hypothetical protein